jgi:hypothetical protein
MEQEGGGGGGGGGENAFLASIKDEKLRADPSLKDFKDADALAKSFVETKAMMGRSIRIPSESAPAEERENFRKEAASKLDLVYLPADEKAREAVEDGIFEKLGRPKDLKGYPDVKAIVKDMPEGIEVDEAQLRETAKKLGLTKKGYATLVQETVERAKSAAVAQSEQRKAIQKELGTATEERLAAAALTAQKLGESAEYVTALRNGAVPVAEMKRWLNVAKALGSEGGDLGGRDPGRNAKLTPDEAKMQISELRRNKALADPMDPAHDAAVAKLHALTAMAYPD